MVNNVTRDKPIPTLVYHLYKLAEELTGGVSTFGK